MEEELVNEYDWKTLMISSLVFGMTVVGTVWGFYFNSFIPYDLASVLTGMFSGCSVMLSVICYLKIRDIKNFYEEDEDDDGIDHTFR